MISNRFIKKIFFPFIILLIVVGIFGYIGLVDAQVAGDRFGLDNAADTGLAQNDLQVSIINIIRLILGFLGIVAVLIILWGGFIWMTASGDANKLDKAKKILISAGIGLAIILGSFIIASFVINSLQGALGPGTTGPPGGCTGPGCTGGPGNSIQYTYVNQLKDDSLSWSRLLGPGFGGVVSMPASDSVEVGGYAKFTGGTIASMDFYTALDGDPLTVQSTFVDVPTDVPVVAGVYAPWDSSSYGINDQYNSKINTIFGDISNLDSGELKTIVKPLHCFNGVTDTAEGETDIDCGGDPILLGDNYCGACGGSACVDDADCAGGVCTESGTCALAPSIDYIKPDNGAVGNYITLFGRHFGPDPGEVIFMLGDTVVGFASLELATGCNDVWTSTQVVFEVPNIALGTYDVVVSTISGLVSAPISFEVNDIVRPGICTVTPKVGIGGDEISIVGNNFPDSVSGEVVWSFLPDNLSSNQVNWIDSNSASDVVPDRGVGRTSVRVYNGTEYSNFYNFLITSGGLGEPCGDGTLACSVSNDCQSGLFCDPNNDCSCQVVVETCSPGDTKSCDDFPGCDGIAVCPASGNWSDATCTKVDSACSPVLSQQPAIYSIYTWAFNTLSVIPIPEPELCGNGQLDVGEACDAGFFTNGSECSAYNAGSGTVSCTTSCQLNFTGCTGGEAVAAATQSVYAWGFYFGLGNIFIAPEIIEDCSRVDTCLEGQNLPSPTPWYEGSGATEGWDKAIHPALSIANPLACVNTVVSGRFTDKMDVDSVKNNITILACATKAGDGCSVFGDSTDIEVLPSSDNKDYFTFNNGDLTPGTWYKVILRSGIKSLINVPMAINTDVVANRSCNGSSLVDDALYCWNFQTRVDASYCEPGCPECQPGSTTINYLYGQQDFASQVMSDDNVCMMIDPLDYDWQWSSENDTKVTVTNNGGWPAQTGTAVGENYFDIPNYTKVNSTISLTGYSDACRVTTNFTDPAVIEDSSCRNGTTQSPTPWSNSENTCLNALVSARFSRSMLDDTLKDLDNIILQKCASQADAQDSSADCGANLITDIDSIKVFDYSHEVLIDDLIGGTTSNAQGVLPEGFVVYPDSNFVADSWYRVIIKGGEAGVHGSRVVNDVELDEVEGILANPNSADYYFWIFKTGNEICDIETVEVSPAQKFMKLVGETQDYSAVAQAANCNILNDSDFVWSWRSLINIGDTGDTGSLIASITNDGTANQLAIGQLDGETNIVAKTQNVSDYGHLQVGFGSLKIIDYLPQNRSHFEDRDVDIKFNIDVQTSSIDINNNIKLYQCTDAKYYYKLNNNVLDSSGWGHDSVVNQGVSFADGYFGQSARFNGTAGRFIQVNDDAMRINGAFTVSVWVKPTAPVSKTGQVIISNYAYNLGGTNQRGWLLGDEWGCSADGCNPPDHIYFKVYNAGASYTAMVDNFFADYKDQWVQVTGVFDPIVDHSVSIYINGESVDSMFTSMTNVVYDPNTPVRIGHRADSAGQGMWIGSIDDVKVYDRALSSDTIAGLSSATDECSVAGLGPQVDLVGIVPTSSGTGPEFLRKIELESSVDYFVGAQYRAIVSGGPTGVLAWNNKLLSGLNFNSTGNGGGEECELNIYPWTESEGICLPTICVLDSIADLCGTRFAECSADDDYCDTECHNKGNSNLATCGDGIVGPTEQCDDDNSDSSDGCSSSCLWEGSSDQWGSLCGNSVVEYGEACDEGDTAPGGSCDSICLLNSGTPDGSTAGDPVCGNSVVETGEDCDDGNTTSGDGCSSTCLLTGSTAGATCGNGLVEVGQIDSYSWAFDSVDDPAVDIAINNCSNGIWSVGVKRGDIGFADIYICEADIIVGSASGTLWNKMIESVKSVVSKFFGIGVSADSDDGCGVGYHVVEKTTANFDNVLEYAGDGQMKYSFEKNGYWDVGRQYKINVYEAGFAIGQSPRVAQSSIIQGYCPIADVEVDIWPRGGQSDSDNFFCIGDDCGQVSSSLYDNDISASWNNDAANWDINDSNSNYDFPYVRSNLNNVDDPDILKNQHLYQAWAVDKNGSRVKAENGFTWSMTDSKFDMSTANFNATNYSGDQWVTLESANVVGAIDGNNTLSVVAYQQENVTGSSEVVKSKDVNIKVFLCSNSWPEPDNFPYRDSNTNCSGDTCPDTNFELYYCRDAGESGLVDDLPSLDTNTVFYTANTSVPFRKEFLLQRGDNDNAIGVRVETNSDHFSPLLWYREKFDPTRQGNPRSIIVDGYQGVLEGRTVYTNAINVEPVLFAPGGDVVLSNYYPNVYLISYSEGADDSTLNIYDQILKYFKLNVGDTNNGGLPDSGQCSGDTNYSCFIDEDCQALEAGICNSDKVKIIRDTKRLADLQDINVLLDDYHEQKRCSNDRTITCFSNAQCYGGGQCAGFYPNILSGTYITGRTVSTWPSWQATLGNALGTGLPIDPINKLYGCNDPYNSDTCWDDVGKKMTNPTDALVYAYKVDGENTGIVKSLYAFPEANKDLWQPADWNTVQFMTVNPFSFGFDSLSRELSNTCGDGNIDADEDCNSCPFDAPVCGVGTACLPNAPADPNDDSFSCQVTTADIDSDGDGVFNDSDNCPFTSNSGQGDVDLDGVGDACDNCNSYKNGSPASINTCYDVNGDDILSSVEKGVCSQIDRDNDGVGDACDSCVNVPNPNPDNDPSVCAVATCGDSITGTGEICDENDCTDTHIAYYKFDNNLDDSSGNAYDATSQGNIPFVSGYLGKSAQFDGSADEFIQIDDPALRISGAITVSAWVRPTAPAQARGQVIVSNFSYNMGDVVPTPNQGWILGDEWGCNGIGCTPEDRVYFMIYDGSGGSTMVNAWNFFDDYQGQWVQVTGVFNPGNSVSIYINGALVETTATTITTIGYNPTTPVRIGLRADSNSFGMWIGDIDEVKIYTTALNSTKVASLYNINCAVKSSFPTNYGICNDTCTAYTYCGDGLVQTPNGGTTGTNGFTEACDDGNGFSGDGCSSQCQVEPTYTCDDNVPSTCYVAGCGNGTIDPGETCDCGDGVGQLPNSSNCGDTTPGAIYTSYNIPSVASLNFYFNPFWVLKYSDSSFPYCKGSGYADACTPNIILAPYCGDGEYSTIPNTEDCEYRSADFSDHFRFGTDTTTLAVNCIKSYADKSVSNCVASPDFDFTVNVNVDATGDYYLTAITSNAENAFFDGGGFDRRHDISIFVDGSNRGSIHPLVDGLNKQRESILLSGLTAGSHNIKLDWTNDFYCYPTNPCPAEANATTLDSNLRVYSVELISAKVSDENLGWGLGTQSDSQYACDFTCSDTGGWCGDGIRQSGYEECDPGVDDLCETSCTFTTCPPYLDDYSIGLTQTEFSTDGSTTIQSDITSCQQAGPIYADVTVTGEIPNNRAAIVFVTDRSGSMSSDMNALKTSLKDGIASMFDQLTDVEIGLVSYSTDLIEDIGPNDPIDFCGNSYVCTADYLDDMNGVIDGYVANGGTAPPEAIDHAKNILNNSSTANTKIIVYMSDGEVSNGPDYCEDNGPAEWTSYDGDACWDDFIGCLFAGITECGSTYSANPTTAAAKSDGIEIYSVAFGGNPDAMNEASSNNGSGDCDHDYCVSGADLSSLYDQIIESIISNLSVHLDVGIGGVNSSLSFPIPDNFSSRTYPNQVIYDGSSSSVCSSGGVDGEAISVSGVSDSTIVFSNLRFGYCPLLPLALSDQSNSTFDGAGQVAGVSESTNIKTGNWFSTLTRIFSNFFGRIFSR